ncbi:gliding motility-associated C-terminal domain-containing protein [Fulvivirgaceae bacterium PWU5]|uniref:Gliding motility-associated C-terminal domain-containing protein n=1 Tax=Dawidia cretensis TaxID=2782350 RepID=A0AAP2GV76_9BACT|nr:PKD-like domain-containing protein [Dawidia cretensis]MBT1708567.1 gliding motility-associated C-terminal domain-containing protein [Dawidia cretensis]
MRSIFLASFLVCLSFFAKAQEYTYASPDGLLNVTFTVVNPCGGAGNNGYIQMRVNAASSPVSLIFIDVDPDGNNPPGIETMYDYPNTGAVGAIPVGGTYIHSPTQNLIANVSNWILQDSDNQINTYTFATTGHNPFTMQNITTPVSITPTQNDNTVCTNPVNGQVQGVINGGSKTIGPGSYTYRWESDNGLAGLPLTGITDGTTPLNLAAQLGVPGLPGGTYTLTVTDRYSPCSAVQAFTITDPSPIKQNLTTPSPLNVCVNDPNITLNLDDSESGVNYTIYRNSTATANTFPGTGAGLTMTFPNTGFVDGDTLKVRAVNGFCTPVWMNGYTILRLRPLPDPKLTGLLSVCQNQTLVVYGTDGFKTNYQWTVSAGGTITAGGGVNDSTVTVTWNTPGNQTVSVNYEDIYGCTALTPKSVTVNVRALPVLAEPQEKSICTGDAAAYEILLNPANTPAGTVFNWADPDAGGQATAGVNVPMGAAGTIHINDVLTNLTTDQTTVTYIVTPSYGSGLSCPGDTVHVKIRVNPRPVLVDNQAKEICADEAVGWEIKLAPANKPDGTTFSWPDPDGGGKATAGTNVAMGAAGTIHINDILENATTANIVVNYIITPRVGSCNGTPDTVKITVKPRPVLADNQLKNICDNEAAAYHILLNPAEEPAGTVYNWPDPDGPTGPATAGVNVAMGTPGTFHINDVLRNTGTTPIDVVYVVTPSNPLSSCVGVAKNVTIRVNPKPVLENNQEVEICAGDNVGWEIKLAPLNEPAGTTFSWPDPDGPSGPGTARTNVQADPAGTIHINDPLTNTDPTDLKVYYIITPTVGSCAGIADTVEVTVRPRPVLALNQAKTICADDTTKYHILLNPVDKPDGTIFNWPDPDGPTGPATAGVNVPMGTASTLHINDILKNDGQTAIQVTYVVTPSLPGGCPGTPRNIVFTVNPKPVLADNQAKTICAGTAAGYHILLDPAQQPLGTTYTWADPDGPGVGNPATGRTNVAMGSAATIHINDILTNADITGADIVVNYVIFPRTGACVGDADTVAITVKPRPVVASGQLKTICSGEAANYHINLNPLDVPPGTVFNWPDPDGAGPATAGVDVPMGTAGTFHITDILTNNLPTKVNLDVVYVVTPSHPSATCPGAPQNVTIRVRPVPVVANNQEKEICAGDAVGYHILLTPADRPTGTNFSWPDPDGAGPATGRTNVAMGTAATIHITDALTNTTGEDVVVNYVITPRIGTGPGACAGVADTIQITVKPRPVLLDKQAKTICSNENTAYRIRLNPAELPEGTVFNWPDPDGTGPAKAGVDVLLGTAPTTHINDVLENTGTEPIEVKYIVTPSLPGAPGDCPGVADTIVFTVSPKPVLAANQAKTICAGVAANYRILLTPADKPDGTTFSWPDPDGPTGPATAGVNVPMADVIHIADILQNTTADDIIVKYAITPSVDGCNGAVDTVRITVKPRPVLRDKQIKEICSGDAVDYHILLDPVDKPAGTVFNWADPDGAGGGTAGVAVSMGTAATLHIQDVLTNNTQDSVDVHYIITPSHPASGCDGVADTVTIRVRRIPVLADGQEVEICSGENVGWEIKLNPIGRPLKTTFSWPDPDGAGPATAGTNVLMGPAGTIHINDELRNTSGEPITVNYVITPSRGGLCAGVADTVKVIVNPGPVLADNQFKQICAGDTVNYHIMLNPAERPVGTEFNWPDPDGPTGPATAGVNVSMGTAATLHIKDILQNTTGASIDVLYIITPSTPGLTCEGEPDTVVIRVNPIPVLADGQETEICAGETVGWEIKLNPANQPLGTTFSWADPDAGGPATAGTDVAMGTAGTIHIDDELSNLTDEDIVLHYIITPTVGTCAGDPDTVQVTVKPRPVLLDKQAKIICSGDTVKYRILLAPPDLPGTTLSWPDPDGPTGPATAGVNVLASDLLHITDVLTNTTSVPLVIRYIVTPTDPASSCAGLADTVLITVNPKPVLVALQETEVCSGDAVGYSIRLTPAGLPATTVFNWADPDGTGPATAGANVSVGAVGTVHIDDMLENTNTTTDLVVKYFVIPSADGCTGLGDTIKVTVKARPVLADNQSKVICSGDTVNYSIQLTPADEPLGTTFSWPDPDGAGPATAGTGVPMGAPGTIHIKDILTNIGIAPITVTYVVTPDNVAATCEGIAKNIVITVNPAPNAGTNTIKDECNDQSSYDLLANLNGTPDTGGTWTDLDASGATITGNIIDLTSLSGGNSYRFRYIVDGGGICKPDTAVLTLNIQDAPYAGDDGAGTVCTLDTDYNLYDQLAPVERTPDTNGAWTDIDGSGAVITGHRADFTGVAVGTYTFRYIVPATTACEADTAFVEIEVIDTAPDAGDDNTEVACNNNGAYNLLDALDGTPDAGGIWRDLDGVGRPIVANVINLTDVTAGQYRFRYVLDIPGCGKDSALVTLNINDALSAGDSDTLQICNVAASVNLFNGLGGTPDAGGNWSELTASGRPISPAGVVDLTGIALGTYRFRYIVTNTTPCVNDTAVVTIELGAPPDAGNGGSVPACNSDDAFDLSTGLSSPHDTNGVWTDLDASGGVITGNLIDLTTPVAPGTYRFKYKVSAIGPCVADSTIVTVVVSPAPNAGVGGTDDVCTSEDDYDLFAFLTGSPATGGTWSAAQPASGAVITGNTVDLRGITVAGLYDFLYIVDGVGVCKDDTATVSLNVTLAADAGLPDSVTVCNTNTAYNLFTEGLQGTPDTGGTWTDLDGSLAVLNPTTGVVNFTGVTPAFYRFRYIVTGTLPCQNDTSVVTVKLINTTPDPGIDTEKDVCSSETAYNMYAALDGTPDPGGDWVDVDGSGATITGDLINLTNVATGTYHFRYELDVAGCGSASAILTLNVTEGPDAGDDTTAPVCTDDAASVNLIALLTGSPDAGGSWLDVDATGVPITPAGIANLSSLSIGTYHFDYVVAGTGPCKNDTTRLTIELSNPPNAGQDSTVVMCTTVTSFDLFTALNPAPTSITGTWREITTSGAPIANGVVNLTGIVAGNYVFEYILPTIGTCDGDTARVTLDYRDNLHAGDDNTVAPCSDDPAYDLFAHLPGAPDAGGVWSSPNWPKVLPASGVIDLRGTAQGTYIFHYIIGAGTACKADTATITMNLKEAPSIANAGPDQIICNSPIGLATLGAIKPTPFFGTGTWVTVSPGGFPVSPNDANSQFIGADGRWFMVRWIVTNGTCTPSVDTVIINFKARPEVISPVTVCLNSTGTVKLNASAPGALSYNWYLVPATGPRVFLDNTAAGEFPAGPELVRTATGSFTYEVTAMYNCGGTFSESGATPITVNVSNSGSCGGSNPGNPGTCPGLTKIKIIETLPTCDIPDGGGFTFVLSGVYDVKLENKNTPPALPTAVGLERGDSVIFTGLTAGRYLYTIYTIGSPLDTCKEQIELELKLKTTVTVDSVRNLKNVTCFGGHDGNATIYAHGSVTGQYYFTYVKNGVESEPMLFTPGAPLPGGLPGDDLDDIIVKVDNAPIFTCPATIRLQIRHNTPEITRDYVVTGATCNANDGSITVNNVGGGSGAPYTYSIDGGAFGSDSEFLELAGGKHWVTIRSGSCERVDTVDVTFPGFVDFEVKLPISDAQCTNNGKSGKIMFEFKNPGLYSVGLSNDPTVEPEKYVDVLVTSSMNSTITIDTLRYGDYYIFAKTSSALCATQQGPFLIRGVQAISYDIYTECKDNVVLMSLINVKGDPNASLDIRIFRKFGSEVFFTSVAFDETVAFDKPSLYPFLTIPDEYVIRVTQTNMLCGIMAADQQPYVVHESLSAQVGERTKSYPDIFNGKMEVVNFFGGVVPYDIQIKLDSAAVPGQTYATDWEEVLLNSNLQYEKQYDHLPAGRYSVMVADSIGCAIELIGRVPLDTDIYIPNIFTPNEDGINDLFFIRNLPADNGAKLVISDRWGKQVYSSNAYQNNWDAKDISDGIYFYRLKIGSGEPLAGWVEVLRGTKP